MPLLRFFLWRKTRDFFVVCFPPKLCLLQNLWFSSRLKNETLQLVWGMKEKTVLTHLQKQIKWYKGCKSGCAILSLFYLTWLVLTVTTAKLMLHRNKAMFKACELILAGFMDLFQKTQLWKERRNQVLEEPTVIRLGVGSSFPVVAEHKCKIYSTEGFYVWEITFHVIWTFSYSFLC